jgi:hypothetical protein
MVSVVEAFRTVDYERFVSLIANGIYDLLRCKLTARR